MEILFGSKVFDNSGKEIGTVDYLIHDSYTGELSKFKVKTKIAEEDLFFRRMTYLKLRSKPLN